MVSWESRLGVPEKSPCILLEVVILRKGPLSIIPSDKRTSENSPNETTQEVSKIPVFTQAWHLSQRNFPTPAPWPTNRQPELGGRLGNRPWCRQESNPGLPRPRLILFHIPSGISACQLEFFPFWK